MTVTDANLVLGRLVPSAFPSVFGPNEDELLDKTVAVAKFEEITSLINRDSEKNMTYEEVAVG